MPLKLAGLVVWFVVRKLHGVRLFAFTHFPARANQTCCDAQLGLVRSVQSLVYAQFLSTVFIAVLRQ
jgi:hypothetical protein